MRLTDDQVRRARCPANKAAHFLWDDLVAGYGLRLTPHAKAFVIQWREGQRKIRETFAIPTDSGQAHRRWPQLSAMDARAEAQKILMGKVTTTDGGAPLAKAMRQWATATASNWSPRFAEKVSRLVDVWIAGEPLKRGKKSPAEEKAVRDLGRTSVASVKRAQMLILYDAMKASGRELGAVECFAIVCMFYRWAIEREMATHNPAVNRLRLSGGRRVRTRVLTDTDLIPLWQAFAVEGYPAFPAFQLLLYTGTRRKETSHAQWREFDLAAGTWTIPASRCKNGVEHVISLSPQALAVVKSLPRVSDDEHLFIGQRDGRIFDFHHALIDRVRKRTVTLGDWRLHDLRRTFRTGLAKLGVSQVVAELCLNHSPKNSLIQVYDQHSYSIEIARAFKKWGAHVAKVIAKVGPQAS